MPFRASFDCLWCGRPYAVSAPMDLEGWAQLCPECLGRAGDNAFLRDRLRAALSDRAGGGIAPGRDRQGDSEAGVEPNGATQPGHALRTDETPTDGPVPSEAALDGEMRRYYAARAAEYDDWYLRRGRYSHGPVHDLAWQAELESAADWLARQPIGGEIVELAAGTGWWSPILAGKGELWLYDAVPEPLERARERLLAHHLRAHLHLRDAWAEPDRKVDALFTGFWLSHVEDARLGRFLDLARQWLRDGGTFCFVDSRPDPQSGASDQPRSSDPGLSRRRLADGREFTIPKIHREPGELASALLRAGFEEPDVTSTPRFFVLGRARART